MHASFRILLFGPPHITRNGVAIRGFESRKALALFSYLVIRNAAVPRSQLADVFWPDQTETRGRGNLRRVLHNLAALLPGCLLVERQTVQFHRAAASTVDVHAFADLVAQGTSTALAAAAALYRGAFLEGVFLDGCPDAEVWLLEERELWQQRALALLKKLAEHHQSQREFAGALETFGRVLALDPWREEAHRSVMDVLVASGEREAATAHYRAYAQRLHDELGVAPEDETTALFEHIHRGAAPQRLPVARHYVPTPPTSLLGRDTELAHIVGLLGQPNCRLLTLTGPGGTGKTHLALATLAEVVPRFADGVWFVDLAPISVPALVALAIAQVVGVQQRSEGSLQQQVITWLRDKQLLLCLDNFEQILDAAPLVSTLLAACPRLKVLVTSRAALDVRGEQRFPIEPLAFPDVERVQKQRANRVATLMTSPAAALFVARATNVLPAFTLTETSAPVVAELCARLDGLPLAIELAAPLLKLFSLDTLLARLDQRLALLTSGRRDHPARHATIRATIDWSYKLLETPAQQLFARLAVFVGGWTLAEAEAVCGEGANTHTTGAYSVAAGLAILLDHSLIRQRPDQHGGTRFVMLETIREYAQEQLAAQGIAETVQHQHFITYRALAQTAAPHLWKEGQSVWLARLTHEHTNLRAALMWAQMHGAIADLLQMATALRLFWLYRGHQREGRRWLEEGIAKATDANVPTAIHAHALYAAGLLVTWDADFARAQRFFEKSLVLFHGLGSVPDIAYVQYELGNALTMQGQYAQAERLLTEAIEMARAINDDYKYYQAMARLGGCAALNGNTAQALAFLQTSLAGMHQYNDAQIKALIFTFIGMVRLQTGEHALAQAAYREALGLFRAMRGRLFLDFLLIGIAGMALVRGNPTQAATLLGTMDALHDLLGTKLILALQPWHSALNHDIRAQRDEFSVERAWRQGQELGIEEALSYADTVIGKAVLAA